MPLPHPALNACLPLLAHCYAAGRPLALHSSPLPRGQAGPARRQLPATAPLASPPAPASVRACGHPRAPGLAMQS